MKTEYNGITISYDESRDKWLFELRGRSRSADSPAKAKEAIDKEPKEKLSQTFPRFKAYWWEYRGFVVVEVTSIADDGYHSIPTFWVSAGGKRRKERGYNLFPVNDHNTAIVEQIKAKDAEREAINEQIGKLREDLQKATAPASLS